ncbi:MAG: sialidase family protein [Candidatus Thermoplasmatota archaeon]
MRPWVACLLLLSLLFAGCASKRQDDDANNGESPSYTDPLGATFLVSSVGEDGPEPSLGVDSMGNIYFQAMEKTMKSTDAGRTWMNVNGLAALPTTLDPYLWLDPVTDRVFANQLYVACSYLTFTDDGGETWVTNPAACGTPANDHQKMATGPYVPGSPLDLAATGHKLLYPNVVYYAVNGLVDSRIAMSIDGGVTFPFVAESFPAVYLPGNDNPGCGGGLHGNVVAGPDGVVYVPSRSGCAGPGGNLTLGGPVVARSFDNGLTWDNTVVADDVGTPYDDKNPDLAIDLENNVYLAFPGGDNRMWLATSSDHGITWSKAVVMTPNLGTTVMPALVAGSPGRIAVAYYAVEDPATSLLANETFLAVPDHVNDTARWSLFVTYSLDALAEQPTFHTYKVTGDDPIQVGGISTNSGDSAGAERNLLDFIDAQIDADGRLYVAFADGCTSDECRGPDAEPGDSRDSTGTFAMLQTGPSLFDGQPDLTAR